jgi:amino acid transporter
MITLGGCGGGGLIAVLRGRLSRALTAQATERSNVSTFSLLAGLGLSATPFTWPSGSGTKDIFIAFSFAVLAFGGFEAAAPLAE